MQDGPQRCQFTQLVGVDAVEGVVTDNENDAEQDDGPQGQVGAGPGRRRSAVPP